MRRLADLTMPIKLRSFLCLTLLCASDAGAQMAFMGLDTRFVQLNFNATCGSTSSIERRNQASMYLPFHSFVEETISTTLENRSSQVTGRYAQDSVLTPGRITASSSASWSAVMTNPNTGPPGCRIDGPGGAAGGMRFTVNRCARYTLSGSASVSVSCGIQTDIANGTSPLSRGGITIALDDPGPVPLAEMRVFASATRGQCSSPASDSATIFREGSLRTDIIYDLIQTFEGGSFIGSYGTATTQGHGSSTVTFDVAYAPAQVTGQVTAAENGRGVRNAVVTLIDSQTQEQHTVLTGSFGFYTFDGVQTGRSYNISAASRRYRFNSQAIDVNNCSHRADFIGFS